MREIKEVIQDIQDQFKNGYIPEKFYLTVNLEVLKRNLKDNGYCEEEIADLLNSIKSSEGYIIE